MSGEEGGFLARWSRRKRGLAPGPEAAPAEEPVTPEPAEAPACVEPEPEFDLSTLPSLDELTADSDVSVFLKPGVPAALRTAALRKMWSLDASIRDFINCVDYQWDFNTPGGLPFGFSNELVGDVGKLLAQAIGQVEKLAEEPSPPSGGRGLGEGGADTPDTDIASGAAHPTLTPPSPAQAGGGDEEAVVLGPAEAVPAPEPLAAPESPLPTPRRRHGGALPA